LPATDCRTRGLGTGRVVGSFAEPGYGNAGLANVVADSSSLPGEFSADTHQRGHTDVPSVWWVLVVGGWWLVVGKKLEAGRCSATERFSRLF
jgi:hypothetical protein